MTGKYSELQIVARTDVYHLRLTGLILAALVERKVLNKDEATALIEDVKDNLPEDQDAFGFALTELQKEFR